MKDKQNRTVIYLYEILTVYISVLTVVNLFFLAIGRFDVTASLLVSLAMLVSSILLIRRSIRVVFKDKHFNLLFVFIILGALIIRLPPNLYLMGGQDQGTYVSMAQQYIKSRSLYAVDSYRATLNVGQKGLYDREGNYIMPSFEKWNRSGNEYSMVFYPGHPSLLSVFSNVFGSNNMAYLLTALSLITLVNFYLIVYYLTKNKTAALIALLFLSLNPVHVFFSKFPVGEITALTFTSTGFYFLLRYLKTTDKGKENIIYLFFSLVSFLAFSLTRMTFFVYLPVIISVALLNNIYRKDKFILSMYAVFNVLILAFSYMYYKTLLYPLFEKIYPNTLGRSLANFFPMDISDLYKIAILFILVGFLLYISTNKSVERFSKKRLPLIYSLVTVVFLYKIIFFTKNDISAIIFSSGTVYERWNILHRGLDAIKHVPLFSISNYISLIGLVVFTVVIIKNLFVRKITKLYTLSILCLYFIFIYLYKTGLMRYDYYNSRYYLMEIIPILLIILALFLSRMLNEGGIKKKISLLLILFVSLYFGAFSFFQLGRYEGNDNSFYESLSSKLSSDDLIIFINKDIYNSKYERNFNSYVAGPLKYFFNYNVLVLEAPEEVFAPLSQSIIKKHGKVYYISNVPIDNGNVFNNEEKITLKYNHFNNSPGCNYHNYEFLRIDNVTEMPLPRALKCKLLPNAYYERSRDYYFGEVSPKIP